MKYSILTIIFLLSLSNTSHARRRPAPQPVPAPAPTAPAPAPPAMFGAVRPPMVNPPIVSDKQPEVQIGDVNYGGTGCPQGSAGVSLSPDRQVISVLFDKFIAQSGSQQSDSKHCKVNVPLLISNGNFHLKIMRVDTRGVIALPQMSRAQLVESYMVSVLGVPVAWAPITTSMSYAIRDMQGPLSEEYLLPITPLNATPIVNGAPNYTTLWSACTNKLNLALETTINLTNESSEDALVSVDTQDGGVTPGIEYIVSWRECL